ncbi:MAG: carbon monoxide dehydrogenase [Gammaproteobacteria bacterium]|nr:carbon monoxide dehydrogenase [Gammaproteobacteria bacterium]
MNIDGQFQLPALRQKVWNKLNDVDVLRDFIPGCESLDQKDETHFEAVIRAKIGPINAKFVSQIELQEMNEPQSYTLSVRSKGGAAGMGEGLASVELNEEDTDTLLHYSVELKVKGKLAQIGSRLINNTVVKLSNQFFESFAAQFENPGKKV